MVEALIIGTILASIGAAAGIYTNQQNIKNNNARWNSSVELADTAHQREVADLRAAGLNPILSAGGSGSAVPSMTTATAENPGQGFSDIASTVANASLTAKMHEGDIAEQRIKKSNLENDGVRSAMLDKTLLEGAPTNGYEAAYLLARKASNGRDPDRKTLEKYIQRFTDTLSTSPTQPEPPIVKDLKNAENDPLTKALQKDLEMNGADHEKFVREWQKRLNERDANDTKDIDWYEGTWELGDDGKFHFIPENWDSKKKNNKKTRRYHA